jgi:hypothetical protein
MTWVASCIAPSSTVVCIIVLPAPATEAARITRFSLLLLATSR